MPFDPEAITPAISFNRVAIIDLPGVALDEGVRLGTGFDLCGLPALAAMIRKRSNHLRLGGDLTDDAILPPLMALSLIDREDKRAVRAAEAICRDYGRRLGYLLATVKRGDAVNREARPEWDDSYWQHWASVRRVYLGGGLAAGLGKAFLPHVRRALKEAGVEDLEVRLATQALVLALIGAARSLEVDADTALVFDFGGSHIKRGVARYRAGALRTLETLPVVRASRGPGVPEVMASLIVETWQAVSATGAALSAEINVSAATYLRDNHPMSWPGGPRSELADLRPTAGEWLAARVSELTEQQVRIRLQHDGTAAAQTYAGEVNAAVLMLGTAFGVGFPSLVGAARSLAAGFRVRAFRS